MFGYMKILKNTILGRYVVADRDLKSGEFLTEDTPFVVGPRNNSLPVCLECHCSIDGSEDGPKCPKCHWPLCEECSLDISSLRYHEKECKIFMENSISFECIDSSMNCKLLDCITPLRMLLNMEADSKRWSEEVDIMQDHLDERKGLPKWIMDEENVVKFIRDTCHLERFSEDLIQKVIGILETNAFEARTKDMYSMVHCIYPRISYMAHSCVPNTSSSIFPSDGYKIKTRVTVDVKENDTLYICYAYILNITSARQAVLREGKYFVCHCARCMDPTELGTNLSTFKCSKCDEGVILSTDPINIDAQWKCNNCEFKTSGQNIERALSVMQTEIDDLQYMDPCASKLEAFERLLKKYKSVLHPKHFINISIKYALVELYGRIPGYELDDLPDILLERKERMCRDILEILDIIEPGKSKSRALTLYELHCPIVLLARSSFHSDIIDEAELKKQMEEPINMLKECVSILEFEDPITPEGALTQSIIQTIKVLEDGYDFY